MRPAPRRRGSENRGLWSHEVQRGGAFLDSSRRYRWKLWREWGGIGPRCLFVMLNPSTADEAADDATIRRCLGYARSWGFEALDVCNLFAFRATDPKDLWRAHVRGEDVIGDRNDAILFQTASGAGLVVAAWGHHGALLDRGRAVLDMLRAAAGAVHCLGVTGTGEPVHPLRQRADLQPLLYSGRDDVLQLTPSPEPRDG